MNIAVDGNLLCGKRTGMGTVVYNVLPFWEPKSGHHITLYVPEKLEDSYERKLQERGIFIRVLESCNYFKWEQRILPKAVRNDKTDVLWCPYNTAPILVDCKTVVSINDVIYMTSPIKSAPSLYKKMGIIYRRMIVPLAARRATQILTISQYAKQEIIKAFKYVSESKTKVIYLGADFSGVYLTDEQRTDFFRNNNIRKPFILGFGSLEERKNSFGLIKAYESLPHAIKDSVQLVLFGFRGYENSEQYEYIKSRGIHNIRLLGYVSNEEKNTLYATAEMFVFPTFSEGFGIPVLEAFINGTPVITSHTTSLPEVAGDAAIYIDPSNTKEIAQAIEKLWSDRGLSEALSQKGSIQLRSFNWEKTAREIFDSIVNA